MEQKFEELTTTKKGDYAEQIFAQKITQHYKQKNINFKIVSHNHGCAHEYDFDLYINNKHIRCDAKAKQNMIIYPAYTAIDYKDYVKYQKYDNFWIVIVDEEKGIIIADNIRNIEKTNPIRFVGRCKGWDEQLIRFKTANFKYFFTLTDVEKKILKSMTKINNKIKEGKS